MQSLITSAGKVDEHGIPALFAPKGTKRAAVPKGSFLPATNVPVAESDNARVNVFAEGIDSTK